MRKKHRPVSAINVTPMVDVMLVLLIVFMVTAPLLTVGVPINLPKVESQALDAQREPLEISLNQDNDFKDLSAEVEDIISALVNLGYSRSEVFSVVMKIKNDTNLSTNIDFTVSQIVPIALKELSGGIE